MRTPGARAKIAACRAAIPGLFAAHGLGRVEHIEANAEGWVNPCFFVSRRSPAATRAGGEESHDLVVRFNARDPHLPKHRREARAMALARAHGLAVPDVVLRDASRAHAPYSVLITRRRPGRNVETCWPDLSEALRQQVAGAAGRELARLHRIGIGIGNGEFGELADVERQDATCRAEGWRDYIAWRLRRHLRETRELGVFDVGTCARIERIVSDDFDALDAVATPKLVHGDFHLGNVLHVDGRITAVLDFEWSLAGDPAWDLVHVEAVDEACPGAATPMLDAYWTARGGGPLESGGEDAALVRRMAIYRHIRHLEMCAVAAQHLTEREAREARHQALAGLDA